MWRICREKLRGFRHTCTFFISPVLTYGTMYPMAIEYTLVCVCVGIGRDGVDGEDRE